MRTRMPPRSLKRSRTNASMASAASWFRISASSVGIVRVSSPVLRAWGKTFSQSSISSSLTLVFFCHSSITGFLPLTVSAKILRLVSACGNR